MAKAEKRKIEGGDAASRSKKQKIKQHWRDSHYRKGPGQSANQIAHGDAGIWATCNKGRESKCVTELRDLLQEFAERFYADELAREEEADDKPTQPNDSSNNNKHISDRDDDEHNENDADDIEAQIESEVASLRHPTKPPLFTNVRIDMQCVIFFKTRAPIEPAPFVHALCTELAASREPKTRLTKRLTPMSCMGRASEEGLEEVGRRVLAPHFHGADTGVKKFAIRPSMRNHGGALTRALVIQRVAGLVGAPHRVDLGEPDLVILVEVYKAHCGMSVVPGDYDSLKRFNLAEIYEPSGDAGRQGIQGGGETAEDKNQAEGG